MSTDRSHLTNPATRLPSVSLVPLSDGEPRLLRAPSRASLVLLLVHSRRCSGCLAYIEQLARGASELADWDAHVCIVVPESDDDGAQLTRAASTFTVLTDPEHRLEGALSIAPAALFVVDQWEQIHETFKSDDHSFPEPAELVRWARYLAIQCPECEGEAL